MYIRKSGRSFDFLYYAAITGQFPGYPEIPLQVFYAKPGEEVEIFTHTTGGFTDQVFVSAEYASRVPEYTKRGRRFRKTFHNLGNPADNGTVFFESEYYRLMPVSAILESRRLIDSGGPKALSMKIIICDENNRNGFLAFLEDDLSSLEESERLEVPLGERMAQAGSL